MMVFIKVVYFILVGLLYSPNDIKFVQDQELDLVQTQDGIYHVVLKPEPFTLVFPGEELHVCAGSDIKLYEHARADTDINADFNSYFFIFKYMAGSENSEFLSIEPDTGMSLNKAHGAKPFDRGQSSYTISRLMHDGTELPLTTYDHLYMALWLDQNKDQFIDQSELIHVMLEFQ